MAADVVPLLATKLFAPRPRLDLVARPQLLARLDAGLRTARCTLVSAPAGAGKTTTVAAWLAGVDRPVAWLTLDERDQDVHQVVRYLGAAFGVESPSGDGPPLPPEVALTRLLNELATRPPGVLVLDDYHAVRDPAVHAAVAFLIEHLVPDVHLVITTREDPPLPLPRMRVRGELVELRAHDLAFSVREAAAAFAGLPLDDAQVAALVERTEGWAAGLQIAGLALRDHADPAGFVTGFTGSHRLVIDYLTAEILDRQPADVRRFLLATVVLDRFCAELCDAVVDTAEGGRAILERLERGNLFVVPLDDDRTWYRYHRLFADALGVRSDRELGAQAVAEVHRRAGDWFAGAALLPESVRHALTAGADHDAADRLEALLPAVFTDTSAHATLRAWLADLPEPLVRSRPLLCLMRAWLAVHELDYTAASAWLAEVDEPRGAVEVTRAFLVAVGQPGTAAEVGRRAEQGLAALPPDATAFRAIGFYCRAQAEFATGRVDRAERAFAEAAATAAAGGLAHGQLTSTTHRVNIARLRGARRHALATAQAALARWDEQVGPPSVGLLRSATAELLIDGDDLAAAQPMAAEGLRIQRRFGNAPPLVLMASLALARLLLAEGDPSAAAEVLAEVPPLGAFAHLLPLLDAAAAQVRLARGEDAAALAWAQSVEPAEPAGSFRFQPQFSVAAIGATLVTPPRILLAVGRARGDETLLKNAERALDTADELAERRQLGWLGLQTSILRAVLADARADADGARRALTAAVLAAEPEGVVRPFLDDAPTLAGLPPRAQGFVDALRRPEPVLRDRHGLPVEPLTAREVEVLRLLAAGRSNAGIAGALFVELSTVKTHLIHVYAKLGVHSRVAAILRARELRLLR